MNLPAAIIFINKDLNDAVKNTIKLQLDIVEEMSKQEFDARLNVQPDYATIIHANHIRILVILDTFQDYINRDKADLVLFFSHGMASIEGGNFGPPKLTVDIQRFNIYDLLRYNNSSEVKIYPQNPPPPSACCCVHSCRCGLGGIFAIEAQDTSGVHCPNSDNIYNNPDFINRK